MENSDGETTSIIRPQSKFKINYIKPCSEEGKKIANVQFSLDTPLDIREVSKILKNSKQLLFKNIKTVESVGIVKFDFGEKSGTFFNNGKLVIRKVKNETDAMALAEIFSNLLKQLTRK